jgi:hypothetical protein
MNTALNTALFTSSITVVIVGAFIWVKLFHKKRKRRYDYPKSRATTGNQKSTAQVSTTRKQKRRRRRTVPTANPTLAETRGLPPMREDHRAVAEHYQN